MGLKLSFLSLSFFHNITPPSPPTTKNIKIIVAKSFYIILFDLLKMVNLQNQRNNIKDNEDSIFNLEDMVILLLDPF